MVSSDVYQTEIVEPFLKLERAGKGKIIELDGGVVGFKKGDDPRILITACHHAQEIYGTYDAVIEFIKNTNHNAIVIPVIDKENFCGYKDSTKAILALKNKEQSGMRLAYFVCDSIKGYNGSPPKKMPWQYGKDDCKNIISQVADIIDRSKLVIDLHNSYMDKYFLITSPTKNADEKMFLDNILRRLSRDEALYDGEFGDRYTYVKKGLFHSDHENTILAYAAEVGVRNLVIEIPVLNKNRGLKNFSDLTRNNSRYLDYIVNLYNKNFGGNKK